MSREEFIKWLETNSGFKRKYASYDDEWVELMNYAEFIFDELVVENDVVIFKWEDWKWGGRETIESTYSFDEFINRYIDFDLKYS